MYAVKQICLTQDVHKLKVLYAGLRIKPLYTHTYAQAPSHPQPREHPQPHEHKVYSLVENNSLYLISQCKLRYVPLFLFMIHFMFVPWDNCELVTMTIGAKSLINILCPIEMVCNCRENESILT